MNSQHAEIKKQIRSRFSNIARSPESEQVFPVGPESAKKLGYDADEIDGLPVEVTESFSGVGNPLSLGNIAPGQSVLDLGCGAGLDSILAARRVGPTGTVIGIDMTPEMLDKAKRNAVSAGVNNVEFLFAEADALPIEGESVDIVITNGVFNLCLDKSMVLAELHRVLRPGGFLQMADILLHDDVTAEEVADKGTWSDWIVGAVKERSLLVMLTEAGFVEAEFLGWTGYNTSPFTEGAMIVAQLPAWPDCRQVINLKTEDLKTMEFSIPLILKSVLEGYALPPNGYHGVATLGQSLWERLEAGRKNERQLTGRQTLRWLTWLKASQWWPVGAQHPFAVIVGCSDSCVPLV